MGIFAAAQDEGAAVACETDKLPKTEVMGEPGCIELACLFCAIHVASDFGDVAGVFVGAVEARRLMHVEVLVWSQDLVKEGRVKVHVFHYEVIGGGERDCRAH